MAKGLFDQHPLRQWAAEGRQDKVLAAVPVVTAWRTAMTNILALNAAVEAARAGEAGMGFAVVADEGHAGYRRAA